MKERKKSEGFKGVGRASRNLAADDSLFAGHERRLHKTMSLRGCSTTAFYCYLFLGAAVVRPERYKPKQGDQGWPQCSQYDATRMRESISFISGVSKPKKNVFTSRCHFFQQVASFVRAALHVNRDLHSKRIHASQTLVSFQSPFFFFFFFFFTNYNVYIVTLCACVVRSRKKERRDMHTMSNVVVLSNQ